MTARSNAQPARWSLAACWANLPLRAKGLLLVAIPLVPLLGTTLVVGAALAEPRALAAFGPNQALMAISIGATLCGVGSVLAMLLFTTGVARRIEQVCANADRLTERVPLLPTPAADDEVGRLAARVAQAAAVLDQQDREQAAAAEALRTYAERTVDLYDRAPCGYHSLDRHGRFVSMNQTELSWLGYSRDEVIDRLAFGDVVTPASRETFSRTFPELQDTGAIRDVEFELVSKTGEVRPVSISATAVRDEHGEFVATRSSVFDITQRKATELALRHSEARLSAILHTVAEGLLIVSAEGEMSFWNPAAERLLGLTHEMMAGQRLTPDHWQVRDTFGNPLPFDQWPVTRGLRTGREIIGEQIRVQRPGGDDVTLSISVAPLWDGSRVSGVVASFEDITERHKAAALLARAKADAERANLAKSEFLSRMSHDLRTPLNAMLGFAQLLEAEAATEGRLDEIRHILKGGDHLLELINEVLDIGRIETGQLSLSPEPLCVVELVERTLGLVRPIADQHTVTLIGLGENVSDVYILADRQRCHQVLLNLLSNAVKYNRPGGRVTVAVRESGPGSLRIEVTDTGAGIRSEKLASMFKPFERLGAEQTGVEGTGLGLSLSKGLVEAMGGTIGVQSVVDEGTTFWVEFPATVPPLQRAPTLAVHSSLALADPLVEGHVLYIEDNAPNVRLMERLLAKRPGVHLRAVAQGRLGLEQVLAHRPDLVLLDLHLPDLPGEEVLRRLWENPTTRSVPVAVLSADATPVQVRRLKQAGAIAYLTKPLDLGAVLGLIDETLRRAPNPAGG